MIGFCTVIQAFLEFLIFPLLLTSDGIIDVSHHTHKKLWFVLSFPIKKEKEWVESLSLSMSVYCIACFLVYPTGRKQRMEVV